LSKFREQVTNSFKFKLFKLKQLPLAYVAGLKVTEINDEKATVSITHNHWTKNPFRSMYFAAQAMAAELSTGLLVMDRVNQAKPKRVSMLVYNMQAEFSKKATGTISFTCEQGEKLDSVFEKILTSDEGEVIELLTTGINQDGEVVSTFRFTWTMKEKK